MPVGVLVKLLARLAFLGGAAAVARRLRRRQGVPATGPAEDGRPAAASAAERAEVLLRRVAETGGLLWRVVAVAVFGAATATLLAAGGTLALLGPRWVGWILLAAAALAAGLSVSELRAARRLQRARLRRRRDELVRRSGDPG